MNCCNGNPVIELEGVGLVRDKHVLLEEISWHVYPGEHWGVLGLNGCGKTTLMKIVSGWLFPSSGTATILGQRFGTCRMADLRCRIGWVSSALEQVIRPRLQALGVVLTGKDATLGIRKEPALADLTLARHALEKAGGADFAERSFCLLSQGEKMRVMIARALINKPQLLVLDEPCAGLDPVARESFLETIENLARLDSAPTMIYVTHHTEELIPAITHVLGMRNGRIVAAGHKDIFAEESVLEDVFGAAFSISLNAGRFWATPRQIKAPTT